MGKSLFEATALCLAPSCAMPLHDFHVPVMYLAHVHPGNYFSLIGLPRLVQLFFCPAGEVRAPISAIAALPMNERKVIAHRAMLMIDRPHAIVNLGIGMPEVHCHVITCILCVTVTVDNATVSN